jgi:hypothetical protein
MLPTKFHFTWPSDFRGEFCLEINQSETRIASGGHVYSKDACSHILIHLVKHLQRRIFKKIGQLETGMTCGGLVW